jgi:hypothetical protein
MKFLLTLFVVCLAFCSFSQSPASFKYQALIRDRNRHAVDEQNVTIRISILKTSIDGQAVYTETHQTMTNPFGMVNLEIGKGTIVSGVFAGIGWGEAEHFIKVEMDLDQDGQYEDAGASQLLSVPYALYAEKSGDQVWQRNESGIHYTSGKVGIGTEMPLEMLHVNGNIRGGQQGGALRVNTNYGYLDVGAKNPDYAHFYTAMPYGFYFGGGPVTVNEQIIGYRASDFHISTQSNSTFQPVKRISVLNGNGYVGINKTNPAYNLDVNGSLNATSIFVNGQPLGSSGSSVWVLNGVKAYYNNGNVGIGFIDPLEKLHINGNLRGNQAGGAVRVQTDYGYLDVGAKNADYAHFYTAMPYGFYFGGGPVTVNEQIVGYKASDFHISTQSNSTFQPEKRISILNATGYVGVGTTTPKSRLEVSAGDVYLSDAAAGVIMKSPDGQCWKMTVSNAGTPVFSTVACPQ